MFGDLLADEFIYGEVSRVSREAPVLILEYDSTEIVPGGAGNAAKNVAALGGAPVAIGAAGRDDTGRRLLEALAPRVNVTGVVRPAGYRTPTKTRILAGGVHSAKQQVVRIDRATRPDLSDAVRHRLEASVARAAAQLPGAARFGLRYWPGPPGRGCGSGARRGPQRPRPGRSSSSTRATRSCGFAA